MSEEMVRPPPSPRKNSKPLMEKRRRARINQSLAELKDLIVCCNKYELQHCRRTKLEKADILELTVRHLHRLQENKHTKDGGKAEVQHSKGCPHEVKEKYCAGFHECVQEIHRYLNNNDVTLDESSQIRLFEHLQLRLRDLNRSQQQQRSEHTTSTTSSSATCSSRSSSKDVRLVESTTTTTTRQQQPNDTEEHAKAVTQRSHVPRELIVHVKSSSKASARNQLAVEAAQDEVWRPW